MPYVQNKLKSHQHDSSGWNTIIIFENSLYKIFQVNPEHFYFDEWDRSTENQICVQLQVNQPVMLIFLLGSMEMVSSGWWRVLFLFLIFL